MRRIRRPMVAGVEGDDLSVIEDFAELRLFLEDFAPRCIGPHETLEQAHRYAGKVELAQQLLEMLRN